MNISVKLHVHGEVRRFNFEGSTFDDFKSHCMDIANLPSDAQFLYSDDEDDMVAFSSDSELQYAVTLLKKEPRLLRVHVKSSSAGGPTPNESSKIQESAGNKFEGGGGPFRGRWRRGGGGGPFAHYPMHPHHHPLHPPFGGGPFAHHPMAPSPYHHPPQGPHYYDNDDDSHSHEGNYHRKWTKLKDLDARFVSHVTCDDGEVVASGASFKKVWRIRNNGASRWPEGSALVRVDHANELSASDITPVNVQPAPGEEVDVSIMLRAPPNSGQYNTYFKFLSPAGKKFGQRIRCQILSVPAEKIEKMSLGPQGNNSPTPVPQQPTPGAFAQQQL